MSPVITTERLTLRWFTLDDASFMFELVNSPLWLEFIGDRNVHSIDQARDYIANGTMKSYEMNGYGAFVVQTLDGTSLGVCGFYKRDYLDYPDIGFAYLPRYVGQGYGYEAAKAVFEYGLNELKLEKILGITNPRNIASIKLLEKLGLRYVKETQSESGNVTLVYST